MTTAIEAAARMRGEPGRVLLHSADDADGLGRYSYAACDPERTVEARGDQVVVRGRGQEPIASFRGDPVAVVEELARAGADGSAAPVAIGTIAYDYGRVLHPRLRADPAAGGELDVWFGIYRAVWRRDERTGRCDIVGSDAAARDHLGAVLARPAQIDDRLRLGPLSASPARDARYVGGFERLADYIRAGDTYQVNLSRQLSAPVLSRGDGLALYRRLAQLSPAAFGAVLEAGDVTVVSVSPELFLSFDGEQLETRPIKGTRRRTGDPVADAESAAELARDEKELAEHLMIVDLERNDLGCVARIGSVAVNDYARVVKLPTLFHMVSTVSCRARSGVSFSEVVSASFPGGSITGAPKLRAMQIIDELEPHRRGVYTGSIGYLASDGSFVMSIAIRTGVLRADRLDLCVGGGVVADSTCARELEETEEKAGAWRRAVSALYCGR